MTLILIREGANIPVVDWMW